MLRQAKRLFRRHPRSSNAPIETVSPDNKEKLPPINKETSSAGNKESSLLTTPKGKHPDSSPHPVKRWLKKVVRSIDRSPIHNGRPKVDNVDYCIQFPSTSELGSPPPCFNETWDNDPEIRRFLWEDATPRDHINWQFREAHPTPRYAPDTLRRSPPSPSPVTPVLPPMFEALRRIISPIRNAPREPASDTVLSTIPDTVVEFNEQGQVRTSTLKRALSIEGAGPQHPVKRVKSLEAEGATYEHERPESSSIDKNDASLNGQPLRTGYKPLESEGSPRKRKRTEDSDISEGDELEYDLPTSPEYHNTSASEESDDSELLPSPKRVKRGGQNPPIKNERSPRPKTKQAKAKKAGGKKRRDSDKSVSEPSDLDFESDEEYTIPKGERNELLNRLTRERAKRLLEAVELPQGHDLSPDEQRTAHQLLTRGCMPTIHRHWEKDFSTLPESLFFSGKDNDSTRTESNFVIESDKGSEFYAIRAFQELLKICGNVRDYCNVLETCPSIYIKRSIQKYLRWALTDASIRVQPNTTPVHFIYCKKENEESKDAFGKVVKKLLKLSDTWRSQLGVSQNGGVWPALIGLVVCGPVLSAITLDTNPQPQTSTPGIKFLGHFDLADFDNDVWNTLAVAITVMHIKRTMKKLAQAYDHPFVAPMFDDPSMGCSPDDDL